MIIYRESIGSKKSLQRQNFCAQNLVQKRCQNHTKIYLFIMKFCFQRKTLKFVNMCEIWMFSHTHAKRMNFLQGRRSLSGKDIKYI